MDRQQLEQQWQRTVQRKKYGNKAEYPASLGVLYWL